MSRLLGCRAAAVVTEFAEIGTDVDKPEDVAAARSLEGVRLRLENTHHFGDVIGKRHGRRGRWPGAPLQSVCT